MAIYSATVCKEEYDAPFFQAVEGLPYHLSVGAVLFNVEGDIACHHFKNGSEEEDIYILMRESMENGETILETLDRGLMEEFGAKAEPIAFLGALSGWVQDPFFCFDKTTLYIACRLIEIDTTQRDPKDHEAHSVVEWHGAEKLIELMKNQGKLYQRVDLDESTVIQRALFLTKQTASAVNQKF